MLKTMKKYWRFILGPIVVLVAIIAVAINSDNWRQPMSQTSEVEQETTPRLVKICPYSFNTFERLTVSDTIKFGNFPEKIITTTDHYSRPTKGVIYVPGKLIIPDSVILKSVQPFLTGATVDSIYDVTRIDKECYFIKEF